MRYALENLQLSVSRIRNIALDIRSTTHESLKDSTVRERHQTIQCATTVILSGFFESFLKDIAEAFITELCLRSIPFADLPSRIQLTHFVEGGVWLSKRAKIELKSNSGMVESEGITRRLASVSGTSYELLWEAFANTKANPGPDTIKDFLANFGIKGAWDKLAKKAEKSPSSLQVMLESFVLIRNECAHTGTAHQIPTPSDIEGYCDIVEQIAQGVLNVLEEYLEDPRLASRSNSKPTV